MNVRTEVKPGVEVDVVRLVTFRLGKDLFAADIASVDRVLRYTVPSHVPDVPLWIEGVLEHRGKVIPVVDMRHRIDLPLADTSITAHTRILVLTTAAGWIGAIVDAVVEVAVISASAMSAPPPLFRGLASHFLRGVATVREQLVVVLEMEQVLTSADRLTFEGVLDVAARRVVKNGAVGGRG